LEERPMLSGAVVGSGSPMATAGIKTKQITIEENNFIFMVHPHSV